MIILVLNAGSSSLKYQLFDMQGSRVMAGGILERIGQPLGTCSHTIAIPGREIQIVQELEIQDHKHGMHLALNLIAGAKDGVLDDLTQIDAIGHRVVQGGESFGTATMVDDGVKQAIRVNSRLAPLHNPPNLTGIEVAQDLLPGIPNIAVFDTEFHQTMPPMAFLYALPYEYYEDFQIRRYGFHGTSHKCISERAAQLMKTTVDGVNLITVHLGNGCSICAVAKGNSVDTSMGMTPLAGLMMGTRTGDFDPAIIGYLLKETGMDIQELDTVLNKKSGLKGICGLNDLRDIHEAAAQGDQRASLAIDMFCYQVKKYIGAYTAVLGKVDALVFSAGVGENDARVRGKICENLSSLGITIDAEKNHAQQTGPFSFHAHDSPVEVWVVPTNEELQIAKEALRILTAAPSSHPIRSVS